MQAGSGWAKIQIIELVSGGQDGAGNELPETPVVVLETRCSYRQISSQVVIQAYALGTNEVFEVSFKKRASFTLNAVKQYAVLFGQKYSITRPLADRRDHVLTLVKRT